MITSLRLRNFKCFSDQALELAPLTLLSGLNGTGKSSVLQALLLLRQSWQQGLLQEGKLALNGDLAQLGTARDALYEGAEQEQIGFDLVWKDGPSAGWTFTYDRGADVLAPVFASFPPEVKGRELFGPDFQYLSAERTGPRTSFPTSDFVVRHQAQLGNHGEFATQFLALHGPRPVLCDGLTLPAASKSLKDQLEAWLGSVSPGTRISVTAHPAMDLVQLQYSFVSGGDVSGWYRPTNVGFGITFVLPVLVATLAAPPGALLLFENPEAHLHPKGQLQLGRFLALAAAAGIQVVLETHSDHVLNGIRLVVHEGRLRPDDARFHFFSRTSLQGHTVVSPKIDRRGRLDRWPDEFFDEWDKSLERLLAPSGG